MEIPLEQIIWDTYYALYQLRLQENMQKAMLLAKEDKESLDKDFYKRVQEQTEKEIEQEEVQLNEDKDLTSIRQKIQSLLN